MNEKVTSSQMLSSKTDTHRSMLNTCTSIYIFNSNNNINICLCSFSYKQCCKDSDVKLYLQTNGKSSSIPHK